MYSLPFDVVLEGEETLLAGNGLKNLFRVSEYEPKTLYTFLCGIQAAFHVFSSMLESPFDRSFFECWSSDFVFVFDSV